MPVVIGVVEIALEELKNVFEDMADGPMSVLLATGVPLLLEDVELRLEKGGVVDA